MRDSAEPSQRLIDQRLRNRVIEALQLAASFDDQQLLERTESAVNETINLWEDFYPAGSGWDFADVYSTEEQEAARSFHSTWEKVADRLPEQQFPDLHDVQRSDAWRELRDAAVAALGVFAQRGKLPDDQEV